MLSTKIIVNIFMPSLFLFFALFSFVWFIIHVKREQVNFKFMISWLFFNLFFLISILYILIIQILAFKNIYVLNIFNFLAKKAFGIKMDNDNYWLILFVFLCVAYLLYKSLSNSIKIVKLNKRVDILSSEFAIISGKVNKTIKHHKFNDNSILMDINDLKQRMKVEKIKEKIKRKTSKKY